MAEENSPSLVATRAKPAWNTRETSATELWTKMFSRNGSTVSSMTKPSLRSQETTPW